MYDPNVGEFLSEDPIGFEGDPTNLYRYVGNHPTYATDPTGLDESIPAAEGRVAGKAIEEALEKAGAETQQAIKRTATCGKQANGVVDAVQAGRNIEIGPASPTGVPTKAAQAASANNADVILYKQKGKIPKAGSMVEYIRLPYDKLKELQAQAKANGWTRQEIWKAAQRMGTTYTTRVSAAAATYAGRLYRGGRLILTGASKCTFGVSPLDFFFDGLDWWQDPEGWKKKPAYLFPGIIIVPTEEYDLGTHHGPIA